ncbi:MAG: hypothetical protein NZ576_12735, partial [Bacteroidia bacterium]|nr:hypothetical protein [Bacteroidia bacterium]
MQVLRSPHPLFTASVEAVAKELLFHPATDSSGKAITAEVILPFDFFISNPAEKRNLVRGTRYTMPTIFNKFQHDSITSVIQRFDRRRTLHWEGELLTDKNGKASFSFYLNDNIGKFRIYAQGISSTGLTGESETFLQTRLPFEVNLQLPNSATVGDTLKVPIEFINRSNFSIAGLFQIQTSKYWKILTLPADTIRLLANTRLKQYLKLLPTTARFLQDTLTYSFGALGYHWQKKHPIELQLPGITLQKSYCTAQKQLQVFSLSSTTPSYARAIWKLYPSPLAQAIATAQAIQKQPKNSLEEWLSAHTIFNLLYLWLEKDSIPLLEFQQQLEHNCQESALAIQNFITPEKLLSRYAGAPPDELVTAYFLACLVQSRWLQNIYSPTLK